MNLHTETERIETLTFLTWHHRIISRLSLQGADLQIIGQGDTQGH